MQAIFEYLFDLQFMGIPSWKILLNHLGNKFLRDRIFLFLFLVN